MGSTISIDNTILGKSLLNKTFITKVPFYYKKYNDNSESFTNNKNNNEDYKFDKGLKFTIHHIDRRWPIDPGFSLDLYITINDENFKEQIKMSVSRYNIINPFTFTMISNEINFNIPICINNDIVEMI